MTKSERRMRRKVDRKQLEKIRSRLGLTQQETADLLGVHVRTWAKWISGERGCPWSVWLVVRSWDEDLEFRKKLYGKKAGGSEKGA